MTIGHYSFIQSKSQCVCICIMFIISIILTSSLRVDGLASRDHTPMEMTEHFEGREDRLYYRHVTYEKIVKRFEPADKERGRHIQVSRASTCCTCTLILYFYRKLWRSFIKIQTNQQMMTYHSALTYLMRGRY